MGKFQPRDIFGEIMFRKKMGLDFNAKMSFFMGISHPLPDWYDKLSGLQKTSWAVYKRFGEFMIFLVLMSNLVLLATNYDDVRVFCTCTGTTIYVFCLITKIIVFRRHIDKFNTVMNEIYSVSSNLNSNPVNNKNFLQIHLDYYKKLKFFGLGKTAATMGGVFSLATFDIIHGLFQTDPNERHLPMFGWFPYKTFENPYFTMYCMFQVVAYLMLLLKDIALDLIFLAILVVLNAHLVYLRKLLGIIVTEIGMDDGEKSKKVKWWIRQHHLVLKTIDDFKIISNPYLFATYISVFLIFFLAGVLLTSKAEWNMFQQVVILNVNFSNLLQLYIFSLMGDEIHENGLKLADDGFEIEALNNPKQLKMLYLNIFTRTTKPVLIKFGEYTPLSAHSFLQIIRMTFSYFVTIIQIHNESNTDVAET